jgi:hypothetical protein
LCECVCRSGPKLESEKKKIKLSFSAKRRAFADQETKWPFRPRPQVLRFFARPAAQQLLRQRLR